MDKLKKTQRSYSSFRAKTQQAQITDDNDNSWIASQNGQKILKHLNHKISTSQLVNGNPHDGLFQSVSQRVIQPKNTAHYNSCMDAQIQNVSEYGFDRKSLSSQQGTDISKMQKVIMHLRQKCKNYEKALQFFNRQRAQGMKYSGQNKENIKQASNFNYSEQYYVREVEDLRRQVLIKDGQLEKYRQLYTTKSTEVQGISKQITQRIQKQNDEKTLYIKELNMRNIELKKLSDRLELFTSQLKTKQFVIKEKQDKIEQLTRQLEGFGHKKLKIEGYEQKIYQNQQRLKEIEQYTVRLKEQIDKKDSMYKEKSQQVNKMETSLDQYEQKLKLIEVSYVEELQKKNKLQETFQELKEQHQKTKQDYIKLTSLKQVIKEKEHENKNLLNSIEVMKGELSRMTEESQGLRQELQMKGKCESKVELYQQEINLLRKTVREKDELICSANSIKEQYRQLEEKHCLTQQQRTRLQVLLQQKDKTVSSVQGQLCTLQSRLQQLNQEHQAMQQQLERARQKQPKIDEFYKQNQKLNSNIHERLNEIEKLQQRIATLETKLTNLAHQNSKVKNLKDDLAQELLKAQSTIEQMHHQLLRQADIRQQLEQQLEQHSQQINKVEHQNTAYKATINQLEQENVRLSNQLDETCEKHDAQTQSLQLKLNEYQKQKYNSEQLIRQTNQKILLLNDTVLQCKNNIQQLVVKQQMHQNMMAQLQIEIEKLQEEKNKLLEEKGKLSKAMERIYSISFQVKSV